MNWGRSLVEARKAFTAMSAKIELASGFVIRFASIVRIATDLRDYKNSDVRTLRRNEDNDPAFEMTISFRVQLNRRLVGQV